MARETYWGISSTGYALCYLLTAIAIVLFVYGVYQRFSRYTEGADDPFARLGDLPRRIVIAATVALANRQHFDRDLYAGLIHSVVETFAAACPMCLTMSKDGRKTGDFEDAIESADIAEGLVEAIDGEATAHIDAVSP